MRLKRSLLALAGTAALALTTLGTGTAAHATTASPGPSVSPYVKPRALGVGVPIACPTGSLCVGAWDADASVWKVFDLDACNRYYLSYFNDSGWYFDNQTGGVTSTFYGRNSNVLRTFTPDSTRHDLDWTPVWSIRNC
ncbi:hypothetical protein ACFCX4_01615 [Kitasatospora sp. NPDC056327]|uniref:hypothetical protein n=1 Tax=Kitasatospora sp. NPDC056327 TaxID=3345785 RepID=UPI0035DDFBE6